MMRQRAWRRRIPTLLVAVAAACCRRRPCRWLRVAWLQASIHRVCCRPSVAWLHGCVCCACYRRRCRRKRLCCVERRLCCRRHVVCLSAAFCRRLLCCCRRRVRERHRWQVEGHTDAGGLNSLIWSIAGHHGEDLMPPAQRQREAARLRRGCGLCYSSGGGGGSSRTLTCWRAPGAGRRGRLPARQPCTRGHIRWPQRPPSAPGLGRGLPRTASSLWRGGAGGESPPGGSAGEWRRQRRRRVRTASAFPAAPRRVQGYAGALISGAGAVQSVQGALGGGLLRRHYGRHCRGWA